MKRFAVMVVAAMAAVGAGKAAFGLHEFKKEFESLYVKADSQDAKDQAFAAAVQDAKCMICHGAKSKKERNAYGKHLEKLLTEDDGDNKAKIRNALEKVAAQKTDPSKPESPTFGERIRQGKLPAGN